MIAKRRTAPKPADAAAQKRLSNQRRRDTACELVLRRELFGRGLRYRVDRRVLTGSRRRHDIVFVTPRVVVDVHGCFWHACPQHGTMPKNNESWWRTKLAANRQRDADTHRRLTAAGWKHIVVWEHEDPGFAANRITRAVKQRSHVH